jgi:hypothetical protein
MGIAADGERRVQMSETRMRKGNRMLRQAGHLLISQPLLLNLYAICVNRSKVDSDFGRSFRSRSGYSKNMNDLAS